MPKVKILAAFIMVVFVSGCSSSPECDSREGKDYVKKVMQAYTQEIGIKDTGFDIQGFKTISANKDSCKCVATVVMGKARTDGEPQVKYAVEFDLPITPKSSYYIEMIN
ncbi:MAG: hypothetical protein PHI96_07965 [Desulfovibrio sp.]|nr:hypothetical protein [Desulfovibrio sp.]